MKTMIETRPKVTAAIMYLGLKAAVSATAADLRAPEVYAAIQAAVVLWALLFSLVRTA